MHAQAGPLLLTALTLALGLPLAERSSETTPERTYFAHAAGVGERAPPVSAGVRRGNTLYLAGHLGIDARTGRAPADGGLEARLVMQAVERTVLAAGLRMDDLVSVTVFSTDPTLNEAFDAVYRTYFHGPYPARGFVGTSTLQRGAHFEVLGIAVSPPRLRL